MVGKKDTDEFACCERCRLSEGNESGNKGKLIIHQFLERQRRRGGGIAIRYDSHVLKQSVCGQIQALLGVRTECRTAVERILR